MEGPPDLPLLAAGRCNVCNSLYRRGTDDWWFLLVERHAERVD